MFWKRCYYFLFLNTSVGAAVSVTVGVALKDNGMDVGGTLSLVILFFCVIGAFVCIAWINVGLGAKFWQVYWEQVLVDFQGKVGLVPSKEDLATSVRLKKKIFPNKDVFSQPRDATHINARVTENLRKKEFIFGDLIKSITCWLPRRMYSFFSLQLYNDLVLTRPSVSRWMHYTACCFFLSWVFAFGYILFCVDKALL